jgi:hypothetical protein
MLLLWSRLSAAVCGRGRGRVQPPPQDDSLVLENKSSATLRLFSDRAGPLASLGPGQAAGLACLRSRHGGKELRAVLLSGETVLRLAYSELPEHDKGPIVVSEAQVRAAIEDIELCKERRRQAAARERRAATAAQSAWRRWRLSRPRLCSGCFREVPAGLSVRSSRRCPHRVCFGCVTCAVRHWDALSVESPRCPEPGCACALEPSATSRAAVPPAALEAFFDGVDRAFARFEAAVDRSSLRALREAERRWQGCRHTVVLAYERRCCLRSNQPGHAWCREGTGARVQVRNETGSACELLVRRGPRKNEQDLHVEPLGQGSLELRAGKGPGRAGAAVLALCEPRSKVQLGYHQRSARPEEDGDTLALVLVVAERARPDPLVLLRRLAASAIQARVRGRQVRKRITCRVCLRDVSLHMTAYVTRTCKHRFCRACIAAYFEHGADKERLRCPEPGCTIEVRQEDVSRVVPGLDRLKRLAAAHDRYREALATAAQDRPFFEWALANARVCPRCKVMLVKDEGCDSMHCICGGAFNYKASRMQPQTQVLRSDLPRP